jgi:hypothetical protein
MNYSILNRRFSLGLLQCTAKCKPNMRQYGCMSSSVCYGSSNHIRSFVVQRYPFLLPCMCLHNVSHDQIHMLLKKFWILRIIYFILIWKTCEEHCQNNAKVLQGQEHSFLVPPYITLSCLFL